MGKWTTLFLPFFGHPPTRVTFARLPANPPLVMLTFPIATVFSDPEYNDDGLHQFGP